MTISVENGSPGEDESTTTGEPKLEEPNQARKNHGPAPRSGIDALVCPDLGAQKTYALTSACALEIPAARPI